eukprot:515456-Prymnesium_polylepis.1
MARPQQAAQGAAPPHRAARHTHARDQRAADKRRARFQAGAGTRAGAASHDAQDEDEGRLRAAV